MSEELSIEDNYVLENEHLSPWILFARKYQGTFEFLRVIGTFQKPYNCSLIMIQEPYNENFWPGRIIFENHFGRISCLWNILSTKFTWNHIRYERIFKCCARL